MSAAPAEGVRLGRDGAARCWWCGEVEDYVAYHDAEWGLPSADDTRLFEKLCLEGFQSGLSWLTILRKRARFRAVFEGFEIERVAAFGATEIERLAADPGIIRHRGKIAATIGNAQATRRLRDETGASLAAFLWRFEPEDADRTVATIGDVPAQTDASRAMATALRKRGFRFFGPTTAYAFMQSMGFVNDHLAGCAAHGACAAARAAFARPTA